jgi:hypothetical protein
MQVKLISNTGDVPPALARIQEEIVNAALSADSGEALLELLQHPINWNLFEIVDEPEAKQAKSPAEKRGR